MIMDPNFIVKVLLSLIVAAALAFAVTPLVKRLAQRVGAMDVPKDERRMHKIPIPRMGGLAIFFAFLIAVLCFAGIDRELRGILLGATIIVVLGILDDILTLNALPKFAVQIVAAVIAVLHGCRIEHFMGFRLATWLSYPVSVIWIVAITNAVNFIDGLDGLAAGVSAISAGSMLVVALLVPDYNSAILLAAIVGACAGFIPYNFNPAKIFMGDTGSTFLGFMLSSISIYGLFKMYCRAVPCAWPADLRYLLRGHPPRLQGSEPDACRPRPCAPSPDRHGLQPEAGRRHRLYALGHSRHGGRRADE